MDYKIGYVYRTRDGKIASQAFQNGYVVIQHSMSNYWIILPEKCLDKHNLSSFQTAT